MMRKVIVTGAAGFLGRAVVRALANAGHTVLATDRVESTECAGERVRFQLADLSNPSELSTLLAPASEGATLVHLAWDMRRHQGFSLQAASVHQFAQSLDAAAGHGIARVVAIGSAEEYGAAGGVIREDTPAVSPFSPYGWAKRAAYELAAAWHARTGVTVVWLRPFIIYGPGQRGDLMIPYAIERARRRERAEFTDGAQRRDFVFVEDVAEAIRLAVERSIEGVQVINLGRGEAVRVADVLNRIADLMDARDVFALGARPRRPGEPDEQVADTSRAAVLLGWRARTGWQEGISRACAGGATACN